MLELYQRACRIALEPAETWFSFIRARFLCTGAQSERHTAIDVEVQSATWRGENQAELRGLLEQRSQDGLPVVLEFSALLDLQTREIVLQSTSPLHYTGSFSENGRLLTLQAQQTGLPVSRNLHSCTQGHCGSCSAPEIQPRVFSANFCVSAAFT